MAEKSREFNRLMVADVQSRSSVMAANQSLISAGVMDSATRCPNLSRGPLAAA